MSKLSPEGFQRALRYAQLAATLEQLLDQLPVLLVETRAARHLSRLRVAAQIGVSPATLLRAETGRCGLRTAILVLKWLAE